MDSRAFDQWMDVVAFEDLFWSVEADIRKDGRWIDVQHPRKPLTKHDNEYLPLLMLAKHEYGARQNWDMRLEVRATVQEETVEGHSFDAEFRFLPMQPDWIDQGRQGRIEFVRGMSTEQSLEFRLQNETLQRDGFVSGPIRDMDHDISEMKAAILAATRNKSGKNYAKDTVLVIWLRDEKNPNFAGHAFADEGFLDEIRREAGRFASLCIVGIASGCRWVKGSGL